MATKINVIPIYLVNFIGSLGFSIVVPFLVFLNLEFGGNSFIFGILLASYSILQIPGAPLLGKLSDKIGRKKVLIISQIGTVICWGIYILAVIVPKVEIFSFEGIEGIESFTFTLPLLLLFVARSLDGFTGGNISVANAYLVDSSTKDELTVKLGRNSLAYNLGYVGGPIIGGVLGSALSGTEAEKAVLPILAAFFLSLCALFVLFKLRALPKVEKTDEKAVTNMAPNIMVSPQKVHRIKQEEKLPSIKDLWKIKHVPYLAIIYFLLNLVIAYISGVFPLHTQTQLGWSAIDLSIFFALNGVCMIIAEGPLLSFLTKKISDGLINILGLIALTASFIFLLQTEDLIALIGAAVSFGIGFSMTTTAQQAAISKIVPKNLQGALHGRLASIMAIGGVIGLISGGILFETITAHGVYIMAAVICGILLVMSIRLLKMEKEQTTS